MTLAQYHERKYKISNLEALIHRITEDPSILVSSYEKIIKRNGTTEIRNVEIRCRNIVFRGSMIITRVVGEPLKITFYGEKGEIIDIIFIFEKTPIGYIMRIRVSKNIKSSEIDPSYLKDIIDFIEERLITELMGKTEIKPLDKPVL